MLNGPKYIALFCSAGVGRTGTFIAVDFLLQHIREHSEMDVYGLVLRMRENRCNMVQTEVGALFSRYSAILTCFI